MDVEALVEAPFLKTNGENGHTSPPVERSSSTPAADSANKRLSRADSSKSRRRSPTPTSEHSRHSSHRKDHDRHRDRDDYSRRDGSRHRDRDYRSESHSRRDDRRYDDKDRYERRSDDRYRDRDDRYRDDRSDRRRSRNDEYDEERSSKRRREYDDRERPRHIDDRNRARSPYKDPPIVRDPSPVLTEDERDLRTIFVQQLASRLRTKELIKFFEQIGPVREAQIVKDRVTQRSKGVGYVEFRNPGSVSEAISLTGQRLLGIPIIVQITEAEKNRQARIDAAAAGIGPSFKEAPIHRLYIGNIHFSLTEEDLKNVFGPFGEIELVQLQKEHDTGRSRGYGFIQFRDPSSAREALDKLNGFELAGRPIRVGLGNDKFTTESTQAILDRYDGFHGAAVDTVPRGGTERIGGGSGGGNSARMASNLDDTDVAGVSFHNVSREALMKKLARNDELKDDPAPRRRNDIAPPTASRCVLLKNMFNPAEETGNNWVKELEDDVKAECEGKYGKVNHIHVEEDSKGEIYIKFDSVSAGEKAIQGLNGRWFGGRTIAASPIADAIYATKFPRVRAL